MLVGLITQIGMGITGTLLPLIIGAIVDCIKGADAPLAQLGRLTQISLGFLLPYYHPRECPDAGNFLLGADYDLRDSGSFFVLDAANSDRTFARHRVRPAK